MLIIENSRHLPMIISSDYGYQRYISRHQRHVIRSTRCIGSDEWLFNFRLFDDFANNASVHIFG